MKKNLKIRIWLKKKHGLPQVSQLKLRFLHGHREYLLHYNLNGVFSKYLMDTAVPEYFTKVF